MQYRAIDFELSGYYYITMRQQRASKVHEDRYVGITSSDHHQEKDELVKHDMLDPPRYLRRTKEDFRGKALSFGVLDWKQLEKYKDSCSVEETKEACSSIYAESAAASSLELDLSTGVVKRLDAADHQSLSRKQRDQSNASEKPNLLDQNVLTLTSKKGRHVSPNRRFSFSFSQMSRSFSSKESSSSVPALSNTSHDASAPKSGPLTFNNSVYSTTKTNNGHSSTRSGPILKPKTEKNNVPLLQAASKQCSSSRSVKALLQFTMRKGINLFQFVVENNNNVLAATMKSSSDSSSSSTRTYTLYTVNEVKNKCSGNWLSRHKNEYPFVHTTIGQIKTVTSSTTTDSAIQKSESVLFGVDNDEEELAAIVQTRNMSQRQKSTSTIILPSGVHTLPKDGNNNAPLPLIERWRSGGACDCGGWDIGCKLRVLCNDHTTKSKSHTFSSFQVFDQERHEPAFKMVSHDDELHSVEFGSSISLLEAFFVSLAVSSHQSWCEEEEEQVVVTGDCPLRKETPAKYATNPPVSPIGRV